MVTSKAVITTPSEYCISWSDKVTDAGADTLLGLGNVVSAIVGACAFELQV